jgi:hypothetical protein
MNGESPCAAAQLGQSLESFVAMELLRQAKWTERPLQLFHYRDKQQREVHLVIERHDGDVIGIEATVARRSVRRNWRHPPARDLAVNPTRQPGLPGDSDDRPLGDHPRAGDT